jgi:hypothetical protein
MGHWLHGMARRAEQIELNRSSCAEMYARVLRPLRVHGAKTELTLARGTGSSNPLPSSGESTANQRTVRRRREREPCGDRIVEMSAEDASCLIRAGWTKLAEWSADEAA